MCPSTSRLDPWWRGEFGSPTHCCVKAIILELVSQSEDLLQSISQDQQCKNLLANAKEWQGKANRDVGWKEPGLSNVVALAWPNWHMSWFPAQKRDQGAEPILFLFLCHPLTAQFRPLNYLFSPVHDKWCDGHVMFSTLGSRHCLAHARSHNAWAVSLVLGPLGDPPSGWWHVPRGRAVCLLCWLRSKSSLPRTLLLNRDRNVRNPCSVFIPHLMSPMKMSSLAALGAAGSHSIRVLVLFKHCFF